jgi:RNA polymerase sigma-70 factor (ECF subfamily)
MAEAKLQRFKELVEPKLNVLYRTAQRLAGNRLDAEDLVQDTCLRAWQQLPEPTDADGIDRWLLSVLYHLFIDEDRRRRRAPVQPVDGADDGIEALLSATPGPDAQAESSEHERLLDAAWRKLERAQRVLLSLRLEGYGLREIEDITGISRNVLRARLHRARRSFARYLREAESELATEPRARRNR